MIVEDVVYFLEMIECGNIAETAKRLGRTYQAVYMSIKRMEKEFGRTLFETNKQGNFCPTQFARYLAEHRAGPFLQMWQELLSSPKRYDEYCDTHIRIGTPKKSIGECTERLCLSFLKMYPEAEIELVYQGIEENRKDVLRGYIDTALVLVEEDDHQCVEILKGFREEYVVDVSDRHPMYGKEQITMEELSKLAVVIQPQNSLERYVLKRFLSEHRNCLIDTYHSAILQELFEQGEAVHLAPRKELENENGMLRISPPQFVEFGLIFRKNISQKRILTEFLKFFSENLYFYK